MLYTCLHIHAAELTKKLWASLRPQSDSHVLQLSKMSGCRQKPRNPRAGSSNARSVQHSPLLWCFILGGRCKSASPHRRRQAWPASDVMSGCGQQLLYSDMCHMTAVMCTRA